MEQDQHYSAGELLDFLKQAGMQGLINPASARSRRNAFERLGRELTDEERRDVRRIDVSDLASRFHKLEGSSIRPETLEVYVQRTRQALNDFLGWKKDPDSFVSAGRERSHAFNRLAGGRAALSPEQRAAERITLQAIENPTDVVPVPIRPDQVVYLANLPLDLTEAEAERIAGIVRAFAHRSGSTDGQPD